MTEDIYYLPVIQANSLKLADVDNPGGRILCKSRDRNVSTITDTSSLFNLTYLSYPRSCAYPSLQFVVSEIDNLELDLLMIFLLHTSIMAIPFYQIRLKLKC